MQANKWLLLCSPPQKKTKLKKKKKKKKKHPRCVDSKADLLRSRHAGDNGGSEVLQLMRGDFKQLLEGVDVVCRQDPSHINDPGASEHVHDLAQPVSPRTSCEGRAVTAWVAVGCILASCCTAYIGDWGLCPLQRWGWPWVRGGGCSCFVVGHSGARVWKLHGRRKHARHDGHEALIRRL